MTPPEGVSSAQGWELCLQLGKQASVPSSHLWIKQSATLWLPKTPMLAPVCSVSGTRETALVWGRRKPVLCH